MIKIPIYNERLKVVFYNENKDIESKYDIEIYPSTEAFTTRLNNGIILVAFNSNKVNSRVVVHECVHIVNFIFKSKGIDLHLDNDESQAYLTDYIFELIHKNTLKMKLEKHITQEQNGDQMKQAKNITKKDLWGNYLYNIFKNYINKEGWLLENKVADILEDNLSNFDENFKTTNKLKKAYQRFYLLELERSECGEFIRPI